ncbi:MAG TPA: DUF1778 domain-containing protein [Actinomycetota bacterium]|nr:DUF1778 domain-containing protein [Actinomycetota bacterium]
MIDNQEAPEGARRGSARAEPRAARASERLEVRLRPEAQRRLRLAADLQHVSVSAFILTAGLESAERVIEEVNSWPVPLAIFEELETALDAPAEPNSTLAAAIQEAAELVERR